MMMNITVERGRGRRIRAIMVIMVVRVIEGRER